MLSIAKIRGPLIMSIFPLQKYTANRKSGNELSDTPMERIKKIFVSTPVEPISKELRMLLTLMGTAGIAGFFVGGVMHTRYSIQKFIENNEATRFYSHYDAQKQLHVSLSSQFVKIGLKYAWRTALFTAIFGSIQLLLTTYYGEPSVWHYVAGGSTAGLLFKMSLGLRGSLAGFIVGGILGGIGGFLSVLLLKLTGIKLEDLQNMSQEWAVARKLKEDELIAESMSDEFKDVQLLYDDNKAVKEILRKQEDKKLKN